MPTEIGLKIFSLNFVDDMLLIHAILKYSTKYVPYVHTKQKHYITHYTYSKHI